MASVFGCAACVENEVTHNSLQASLPSLRQSPAQVGLQAANQPAQKVAGLQLGRAQAVAGVEASGSWDLEMCEPFWLAGSAQNHHWKCHSKACLASTHAAWSHLRARPSW